MRIVYFANTDWYLYNFRLPLAREARKRGHDVVLVSPPGPYVERLRGEGFRWEPVPMSRRGFNPIAELRALAALYRLYASLRPDVVHHFTVKCIVYGGVIARTLRVRRVVSAVAGMGYVFGSRDAMARVLRAPVRFLMRSAMGGPGAVTIVQNPEDGEAILVAKLIAPRQLRLIRGSGVNTDRFRPACTAAPRTPPRVLFPARLLRDKGIAEFVALAGRIGAEGIAAEFIAAGERDPGNPASIGDGELERWRREGRVTFLGHVEDMAALLNTVALVVLPTTYSEGVPRGLLEAAAAAIPVVTTDAPGCREAVVHGDNGLLVPPHDLEALVDAVRGLLLAPERALAMGARGRERVCAEFDERRVIEDTLGTYEEPRTDIAQPCACLP
ncbi:MAG: glycosyltransferase family 4 protein [Burkholderiales bacterium]